MSTTGCAYAAFLSGSAIAKPKNAPSTNIAEKLPQKTFWFSPTYFCSLDRPQTPIRRNGWNFIDKFLALEDINLDRWWNRDIDKNWHEKFIRQPF
ncbi:hypothetical protein [Nostoc sp.]|uniref:hypothetical protein n=1 Tax=Nostoc sp. TaxID=1180 RepID=UPI002FF711B5